MWKTIWNQNQKGSKNLTLIATINNEEKTVWLEVRSLTERDLQMKRTDQLVSPYEQHSWWKKQPSNSNPDYKRKFLEYKQKGCMNHPVFMECFKQLQIYA